MQEGRTAILARRYPIIIEQTGTGYSAYSPDLPGCAAVGDSEEETRRNFQDALNCLPAKNGRQGPGGRS
ncbi:MAG: type II toxin-antitoxin system HicB family antitoxin [Bryobacteraceae bacterium]